MRYIPLLITFAMILPAQVLAEVVIDITFPVQGETTFIDDFDQPRWDGTHDATDIMAEKMTPIVAAMGGVVTWAPNPEPSYGFMLTINGDDGYTYNYIHLNNDTPGTDDGNGGTEYAYAPGVSQGAHVARGQHISWVGDSGNAEGIISHLHFEIYNGDTPINPYQSLLAAQGGTPISEDELTYNIASEILLATSINADQDIPPAEGEVLCESDSLIRTPDVSTVYYCGSNGGRYVFQNESTFFSWYDNFDDVQYVTTQEMGDIRMKGVVTYKPGSYMVKLLSVPKVYAVAKDGTLRWVQSEEIAEALYGSDWASQVRDLPDSFFPSYTIGEDVSVINS